MYFAQISIKGKVFTLTRIIHQSAV